MPHWDPKNLRKHFAKRKEQDALCLVESFGIQPDDPNGEGKYEVASRNVVSHAWAEYEAEEKEEGCDFYREPRAFFVDDELLLAITPIDRDTFITCYHFHLKGRKWHEIIPDVGRRQLKFRRRIAQKVEMEKLRNLIKIHGFKSKKNS